MEDLRSLHHLAETATGESADVVRRLLERNPDATLDALPLAQLDESRTLHNARLFLALLGDRGEVKAAPKGNLPRAIVSELRERMRRPPGSRDEWFEGR